MDHLLTEIGQRSYLPKLIYEITDKIMAHINLALETIPMVSITDTYALIYTAVKTLKENLGKKVRVPKHLTMLGSNMWKRRSSN